MNRFFRISIRQLIEVVFVLAISSALLPTPAAGQRRGGDDENPLFREYRGIQIGMTADETRKKLGNPKDKADDQDIYFFGEKESAQIVYDKAHKVSVLSVDFLNGATGVPTPKSVFGDDVAAKPDGSIYKMIRYKKAGYWVSYNRTAGDSPMISITIQRIE